MPCNLFYKPTALNVAAFEELLSLVYKVGEASRFVLKNKLVKNYWV